MSQEQPNKIEGGSPHIDSCPNCDEFRAKIATLTHGLQRKEVKMDRLKVVIDEYDIAYDEVFQLLQAESKINLQKILRLRSNCNVQCMECVDLKHEVTRLTQALNGKKQEIGVMQKSIMNEKVIATQPHDSDQNLQSLLEDMDSLTAVPRKPSPNGNSAIKRLQNVIEAQKTELDVFACTIRQMKLEINAKDWELNAANQANDQLNRSIDEMTNSDETKIEISKHSDVNSMNGIHNLMEFVCGSDVDVVGEQRLNALIEALRELIPEIMEKLDAARLERGKWMKENDETEQAMVALQIKATHKAEIHQKELSMMKEDIDELEHALAERMKENKYLQKENVNLNKDILASLEKLKNLEHAEIDKYKSEIRHSRKQMEDLVIENDELKAIVFDAEHEDIENTKNGELEEKINILKTERRDSDVEIGRLKQEMSNLTDINIELRAERIEQQKENEMQIKRMSETIDVNIKHAKSYVQIEQLEIEKRDDEIEALTRSQRTSEVKITEVEVQNVRLLKELEDLKSENKRLNEIINACDTQLEAKFVAEQELQSSKENAVKLQQKLDECSKMNQALNATIISMEQRNTKNEELSRKSMQEIATLSEETVELQNALNIKNLTLQQIKRNDDSMSYKLQHQMEQNDNLHEALSASQEKCKELVRQSSEEFVFLKRRLSEYELLSECMDGVNLNNADDEELAITKNALKLTENELVAKNQTIDCLQIKLSSKDDDFRILQEKGNKLKSEMDFLLEAIQKRQASGAGMLTLCKMIGFMLFVGGGVGIFGHYAFGRQSSVDTARGDNLSCDADDIDGVADSRSNDNSWAYQLFVVIYVCLIAAAIGYLLFYKVAQEKINISKKHRDARKIRTKSAPISAR